MTETMPALQLDRHDRHVWRSYVRMNQRSSQHRVTLALEEALRLVDLPGESEGRVYYFRRVSLRATSAQASRQTWIERVQQALSEPAAAAVHGCDPRAALANAVFFDNQEQALEALLRQALRFGTRPAWFAAAVLGLAPETSNEISILSIVERLRQPNMPRGVAAAIILAALGNSDPAPLLDTLPAFMVQDWVREMDSKESVMEDAPPILLPPQLKSMLQQAAQQFGWREPHTVWLAALAVSRLAPATLASGTAVKRARATLQRMKAEQPQGRTPPMNSTPVKSTLRHSVIRGFVFEFQKDGTNKDGTNREVAPVNGGSSDSAPLPTSPPAANSIAADFPGAAEFALAEAALSEALSPVNSVARPALLGEPTAAAGLYFLLHALRHLGIAEALQTCPALVEANFVAHLLKRLAKHAEVAANDPILLCLATEETEFSLDPAALSPHASIVPKNFLVRPPTRWDNHTLLRAWTLAVRRWCWHTGKITVREIVQRNGWVWLTRTDLDVTLPLAAVDIRIRRIGLDLDPGWLPWFGEFGRVVRFHYHDRER